MALAQKIANEPKEGDGKLLVIVSKKRVPPHARHQVIDAIDKLAKEGKLDDTERGELLNILDRFDAELKNDHTADKHAKRIEQVRQELGKAA